MSTEKNYSVQPKLETFLKQSLDNQYCRAQFKNRIPSEKIYRVFIGRYSFANVCRYINEHNIGEKILKTIYCDTELYTVFSKMIKDFLYLVKNNKGIGTFSYGIIIFSDVLIHGGILQGWLSVCEKIFAEQLEKQNIDDSKDKSEELYDKFLNFVKIDAALNNGKLYLIETKYLKCMVSHDKTLERKNLKEFSFQIAETAFHSDMFAPSFIPVLKFKENFSNADVEKAFQHCRSEKRLTDFRMVKNGYCGKETHNYIAVFSENDAVKFVFTVRCTGKHIIPFVFLPALHFSQFNKIFSDLFRKEPSLKKHSAALLDIKKDYRMQENMSLYVKLANMIITTVFFRAFLDESDRRAELQFSSENIDMMEYDYIHDERIKEIVKSLLDFSRKPHISLSVLKKILYDNIGTNRYIFKGISDITANDRYNKSADFIQKTERKFEKAVFDYGIYSEKKAYAMRDFPVTYSSMRYFLFPSGNIVGNLLQKVYSYKGSWMRRNISLNNAFAYLLKMMDMGCISLTVGENNKDYIQCLQADKQSVNMLIYRYAKYLPFLNEIQTKCRRQGNNDPSGLYYEFRYFFDACHEYGKKNFVDMTRIENILKKQQYYLIYIVYQLYKSGQNCEDYMYLTDKKMKNVAPSYIESWKKLYADIVY